MSYDVEISRAPLRTLIDLKGEAAALADWAGATLPPLPDGPNRFTSAEGLDLCHIGRNHWLLCASIEREEALLRALDPAGAPVDISIVRVSDTLCFFEITGPDAAQIMAIACPLDLHPAVFGARSVSFTEAFGLKALVRRVTGGFELAVEQSFGDMVEETFARANA